MKKNQFTIHTEHVLLLNLIVIIVTARSRLRARARVYKMLTTYLTLR